jgi:ribose 1,5-bisphosphokinase PhnN
MPHPDLRLLTDPALPDNLSDIYKVRLLRAALIECRGRDKDHLIEQALQRTEDRSPKGDDVLIISATGEHIRQKDWQDPLAERQNWHGSSS